MRGVYIIESPSGKRYIGRAAVIRTRLSTHKWLANANMSSCMAVAKAIRKYGWEKMRITKIPVAGDVDILAIERFFIMLFQSNDYRFGYNLTQGGEGSLGRPHTPEEIRRISSAQIGNYPSKDIAESYRNGSSIRRLSKQFGIPRTTIGRVLKRENVAIRPADSKGLPSLYAKPGRRLTINERQHLSRLRSGRPLHHSPEGKRLIIERARQVCIDRANRFEFRGQLLRISEIGKLLGISYQAVHYRMKVGKL